MSFDTPSPCPYRILDDLGSAFAMGCLGGSVWHGFKGMRNSPRGKRLRGGFNTVTLRAPSLGGNFAVWGGLFSSYDCAFMHLRGREDPWNAIAAGAFTGGTLAARSGMKNLGKNALIGGLLLAGIEGLQILISKSMAPPPPQMPMIPTTIAPPAPLLSFNAAAQQGLEIAAASSSVNAPSMLSVRPDEEFGVDDFSFDPNQLTFEDDE